MYCVEFFWNQKIFHLYVYIIFLKKLSANISDSSFLLDSLSKAKILPNFSTGENFQIIINLFSIFLLYRKKIIVFDKFQIDNCCVAI